MQRIIRIIRIAASIAIIAMVDDNHNHGPAQETHKNYAQNQPPSGADNIFAPSKLNETVATTIAGTRRGHVERRSTGESVNGHQMKRDSVDDEKEALIDSNDKFARPRKISNATNFDKIHPPPMATKTPFRMPLISQQKFDWDQVSGLIREKRTRI